MDQSRLAKNKREQDWDLTGRVLEGGRGWDAGEEVDGLSLYLAVVQREGAQRHASAGVQRVALVRSASSRVVAVRRGMAAAVAAAVAVAAAASGADGVKGRQDRWLPQLLPDAPLPHDSLCLKSSRSTMSLIFLF